MNLRFVFTLLILPFVCFGFCQQPPQTILPGDGTIDGSCIRDYTNKWSVIYVDAEGKETANKIWTDYGQIIELDGKKYFHRVQDLYDPNMNLQETWINMVEHDGLIPVSFSKITPAGKFNFIAFDGASINNTTNFQSENLEPTTSNLEFDQVVYDWNLYGMLLVGLPFEEGFSAKLPFYSNQTSKLDWITIEVEGKENLRQPNEMEVTTWIFSTDKNLTFWLTKEAPYVHRLELTLQNNSKLIWETF